MIASRIICLIIGYIFGLFQTGYICGKVCKIDIRNHGSGNAGTTNTIRVLGWKAGLITFAGDLGKSMLAVLVAWALFHNEYPEGMKVLQMYAGLGAVLGHNYPFYLKFKGGKGIACTSGAVIATLWQTVPVCAVIFIGIVAFTRYISLGSILLVLAFWIQLFIFGQMGILQISNEYLVELYIVGAIFTLLAIWRHRANVKRLLTGTENKIEFKKKGA